MQLTDLSGVVVAPQSPSAGFEHVSRHHSALLQEYVGDHDRVGVDTADDSPAS